MARTWRTERTTPKEPRKDTPRPRVSDFARDYYQGKGYVVELPQDDTVTGDARVYVEADS